MSSKSKTKSNKAKGAGSPPDSPSVEPRSPPPSLKETADKHAERQKPPVGPSATPILSANNRSPSPAKGAR
jgi:hypothetical protein